MPTTMAVSVTLQGHQQALAEQGRAPGIDDQSNSDTPLPSPTKPGTRTRCSSRRRDHDGKVDEDVEQGDGNEGFVGLGGVIDQLLGLAGQFDEGRSWWPPPSS